MRQDLNKQLCERQRHGSTRKFHSERRLKLFNDMRGEELENLPKREGMKKRYRVNRVDKELNENLNPLYGLVRKNVNRPWNKVYSELCEVFDMKSVINRHILQHLFSMVELKTFIDDDGDLMYRGGYRRGAQAVLDDNGPEYYVHPTTGILLKNPHYESWRQSKNRRSKEWRQAKGDTEFRKIIDDTHELRRRGVDGVWFLCTLEKFEGRYKEIKRPTTDKDGNITYVVEKREVSSYDAWVKGTVRYDGKSTYNGLLKNKYRLDDDISKVGYFTKSIKTASSKELKQYGLK